jgi:Zn-dependent peptidase ImmA (M78 family)
VLLELLKETIKNISEDIYENVKKEALLIREDLGGSSDKALQERIFKIIEEKAILIRFPIKDEELCGFIYKYKGKLFVYINTYLPLEKQIFAAGHELYHLIRERNGENELLKSQELNLDEDITVKDLEDRKANLFSALLLVPTESLKKELELMNLQSASQLTLLNIIKLMDIFAIPYKTIIIRLYEIDFISQKQAKKWLQIKDRDSDEGVLFEIEKHQIGQRWQKRSNEVKCSDLKAQIIDNKNDELFSEDKIEEFMNLLKEASSETIE